MNDVHNKQLSFSVEGLADILSQSKATIEARIKRGDLTPCQKTGLIPLDQVEHYQEVQSIVDSKWDEELKTTPQRDYKLAELFAGGGGLSWPEVKQMIATKLSELPDVSIRVYEPSNVAKQKTVVEQSTPKMTPGRAALVGLIDRYLKGLLDPAITLLEVHKLMYFLQEAGEPLRLEYQKDAYGPYASNLRHVFNKIEGHYIRGYQDGGDAPDKQINLLPGAIEKAKKLLQQQEPTHQRFERVSRLVEGFESAYGLELLATVYWVINRESASTAEQTLAKVHAWNQRKQQFTQKQIEIAHRVLVGQGWV